MKKLVAFLLVAVMLFSFSSAYAGDWGDHHSRGYRYDRGHWWLGDSIIAGLAVGTILATLPPHYSTVYVGNVPYYYDGTYYYQSGPTVCCEASHRVPQHVYRANPFLSLVDSSAYRCHASCLGLVDVVVG